jgi:hypothetical protein
MKRYLLEVNALIVVDSSHSPDDVAINFSARLEELAESSAHLLDYEIIPYALPEPSGSSH